MAGTQLATIVVICMCEIWAFDESVVSWEQKSTLFKFYAPYLVVPLIMMMDMSYRVERRVSILAEKAKGQ
jgi:DMSO reductase anchor subunit